MYRNKRITKNLQTYELINHFFLYTINKTFIKFYAV